MALVHLEDSFNRPTGTTQYAANDLVANSTTAASVVPLSWVIPTGLGRGFKIQEWHLYKSDGADVTGADFDLYLWHTSPTSTAGDNEAFVTSNVMAATSSGFLGVLAGGQMTGASDDAIGVYAMNQSNTIYHSIHGFNTLYGLLVAQGTYTPADSEEFRVHLMLETFA